jgi:hypothetical protein
MFSLGLLLANFICIKIQEGTGIRNWIFEIQS